MTDRPPREFSQRRQPDDEPDPSEMERLRELILGAEQREIRAIREHLADPAIRAREIGNVLPEAMMIRAARDDRLAEALSPTIADVLRTSIRRDSQAIGDALFPVMGPAIRKAITSTLWSMIQSLNQMLEQSVSFQGLKWRLEAFRTRKSFAEIVLLHTLVYRVEQALLIQSESGLLLQHVVAREASMEDPDLVSSMLTAIQDFVRDSFGASMEDTLENLRMGDRHVLVEQHGGLTLAAVIRGTPPADFSSRMQGVLETVHLKSSAKLDAFDGDSNAFEAIRPDLEACLETKLQEKKKHTSPLLWAIPALLLVLLGAWLYHDMERRHQWKRFVDRLQAQPGLVVTATEKHGGQMHIHGFKDPLTDLPPALSNEFPDMDLQKIRFHWEPFRSLDPQMVFARLISRVPPTETVSMNLTGQRIVAKGAALGPWVLAFQNAVADVDSGLAIDSGEVVNISTRLQPPPEVSLSVTDSRLVAKGEARHQWIVEARRMAADLPGITGYDDTAVVDLDRITLNQIKARLQSQALFFAPGATVLNDRQRQVLKDVARQLKDFFALAESLGEPVHLAVIGQADPLGTAAHNLKISQDRATAVRNYLIGQGVDEQKIIGIGIGETAEVLPKATDAARQPSRRVVFAVRDGNAPGI